MMRLEMVRLVLLLGEPADHANVYRLKEATLRRRFIRVWSKGLKKVKDRARFELEGRPLGVS